MAFRFSSAWEPQPFNSEALVEIYRKERQHGVKNMELLSSWAGWQFATVIRSGEKRAALFNLRQDPIVRIPFVSRMRRDNPLSDPQLIFGVPVRGVGYVAFARPILAFDGIL
jgi:hypothetical protein